MALHRDGKGKDKKKQMLRYTQPFHIYLGEVRLEFPEEHPKELVKVAGNRWKNKTDVERERYADLEKEIRKKLSLLKWWRIKTRRAQTRAEGEGENIAANENQPEEESDDDEDLPHVGPLAQFRLQYPALGNLPARNIPLAFQPRQQQNNVGFGPLTFGQPAREGIFGQPTGGGIFGQPAREGIFGQPTRGGIFGQPAREGIFGQPTGGGIFGQPARFPADYPPARNFTFGVQPQLERNNAEARPGILGQPQLERNNAEARPGILGQPQLERNNAEARPGNFGQATGVGTFGQATGVGTFGQLGGGGLYGQTAGGSPFGQPAGGVIFGQSATVPANDPPARNFIFGAQPQQRPGIFHFGQPADPPVLNQPQGFTFGRNVGGGDQQPNLNQPRRIPNDAMPGFLLPPPQPNDAGIRQGFLFQMNDYLANRAADGNTMQPPGAEKPHFPPAQ